MEATLSERTSIKMHRFVPFATTRNNRKHSAMLRSVVPCLPWRAMTAHGNYGRWPNVRNG